MAAGRLIQPGGPRVRETCHTRFLLTLNPLATEFPFKF